MFQTAVQTPPPPRLPEDTLIEARRRNLITEGELTALLRLELAHARYHATRLEARHKLFLVSLTSCPN